MSLIYSASSICAHTVLNKHDCISITQKSACYFDEIERFSFECRKTKTKVITLTKQSYEPIRARSKYMSPVPSAGKRVRVNHDWFWFYFWLVEKVARDFLTNHKAQLALLDHWVICYCYFDSWCSGWRHARWIPCGQTRARSRTKLHYGRAKVCEDKRGIVEFENWFEILILNDGKTEWLIDRED